ncbi:LuxR C-terminal-related transcriptional regulator [Nonomuraea typhae]|uniref:LuxR C-terminal-related transcriptional regulator n=1 Tax=Nonomuraea typhae TaxID=2603600 RepID=A0ABW7Z137_9ACTN
MLPAPSFEHLVGRDSEIARLQDVVESLAAGRGTVVEIAGDSGIGKTSLLGVLAALAGRSGIRVLRAHAVRGPRRLPYQLFRDAWGEDFGAGEAVRGLFAHWAAEGGGVVILDDLQWCDEDSADLVALLIRAPVPGPFVLAVAHRPRQTRPLLLEALDHGAQTGTVLRLEPGPLTPGAVAAVLALVQLDQGAGARRYAERLHEACGGNPRNLRILVAAGWEPDSWPDRAGTDRDALLREAATLAAELDELTPDAAATIGAAAVLGDPFRLEDVAVVSGLGLDRTLDALAELTRGDLVRPLASGGRFAFRHRVLGHVAHERAVPSFLLPAHRRALALLSARGAPAAARARHAEYVVGADGAPALQALADGAADVVGVRPATAARWLLLVLDASPRGDRMDQDRATLTLSCCQALIAAGLLDEARALAHDVLCDLSYLPADLRLAAHAVCADVERLMGRYEEAEAMAHAALGELPRPLPSPLPVGAAELTFKYGLVHILRNTYGQARPLVREVAAAADGLAGPAQLGLRVLAAFGDSYLAEMATAIPEVTACARLVDGLPDATAARIPEALAMVGCAEIYLQRFGDAYRHLRRGLKIMNGGAQRHVAIHHLLGLAVLDQWTGRLDRAVEQALEAERVARAIGADDAEGFAMTIRATALLWARSRRDTAEIVALAEAGYRGTSPGQGWWGGAAAGNLALIRLMNRDPRGCAQILLEAGGGTGLPLAQAQCRPELLAVLAMAALQCGDRPAADRSAAEAEEAAANAGLTAQRASAWRARAMLHQADGDHDAAVKLFEDAADAFRLTGTPVQHAWTLVCGARSAAVALGQKAGLSWLDSAVAGSRGCGAIRVREEAARVRAELASAAPAALGILTEREREIAELAAAGRRSREIADQLFLSPRTVEAHLARVYRKLEVSSRAALAAVLLRVPR